MSSVLSKAAILAASDLKVERVAVPEWGGAVCVRVMSGTERDAWEAEQYGRSNARAGSDLQDFRARFVARCLCDESGALLFTLAEVSALGGKSASALDRVYDAAKRVNALSKADEDALLGNSVGAPSGAAGSVSP